MGENSEPNRQDMTLNGNSTGSDLDNRRLSQDRVARPQTGQLYSSWRLLLQIGEGTQTTIGIEVKDDEVVFGRSDPVATYSPEVDLTPYGGQEGGVSRRHAMITRDYDNRTLYIEDLGSTNGSRINGFALEPHKRYRLRDADELELGRVRITVRFKKAPSA